MKVPLSWIKKFVPLDIPVEKIAEQLISLGLEVEHIQRTDSFTGVVVGQVEEVEKHPHAEKLQVAQVSDGAGNLFQVVCGAPNCRKGLKTAFAKIGAQLKVKEGEEEKNWTIKKAKLRDIESWGMLCSSKELGLGDNHEGIIEFAEDVKVGIEVKDLVDDPILHISLTPNLGHCLSIYGIARELAAFNKLSLTSLSSMQNVYRETSSLLPKVKIENSSLASLYALRKIRGVKIGPSPAWVVKKLLAAGVTPVFNVVDIANLVMIELGQPLHVFDADTLAFPCMEVTALKEPQEFVGLNQNSYLLPAGTLVIKNGEQLAAIAGIMGSCSTQVTEKTVDLLIEAAVFSPSLLRKTAKKLDLHTDSCYRFERGVDPGSSLAALDYAVSLIKEVAGGDVIAEGVVSKSTIIPRTITLRIERVKKLLGISIDTQEIEQILERLGLKVSSISALEMQVSIPSYRNDLSIEVDLIEEVIRHYGLDKLRDKKTFFSVSSLPDTPLFSLETQLVHFLKQQGLQEVITCNLISPKEAELCLGHGLSSSHLISMLNAHSVEQSVLRPSLFTSLCHVLYKNQCHGTKDMALFEIGKVHFYNYPPEKEGKVEEKMVLGIALCGEKDKIHWSSKTKFFDFFTLKGIVEALLQEIGIKEKCKEEISHYPMFHPYQQLMITLEGEVLAVLGQMHPQFLSHFSLQQPLFFCELHLDLLLKQEGKEKKYKDLPVFPASHRDWTLTLSEQIPFSLVCNHLEKFKPSILEKMELIDLFQKEGEKRLHLTFRFTYRDSKKTLAMENVEKAHNFFTQAVTKELSSL